MPCDELVVLHNTGGSVTGTAVRVEISKTGEDQIDLFCGGGECRAIVCVTMNSAGELMVELTDESEDDDKKKTLIYRDGTWIIEA